MQRLQRSLTVHLYATCWSLAAIADTVREDEMLGNQGVLRAYFKRGFANREVKAYCCCVRRFW